MGIGIFTIDGTRYFSDCPVMALIQNLIDVAEAYGSATGLRPQTVSSRVFRDTKKLPAILTGSDISTRRLEAALVWFSNHWPDGAEWPKSVKRPERSDSNPVRPVKKPISPHKRKSHNQGLNQ